MIRVLACFAFMISASQGLALNRPTQELNRLADEWVDTADTENGWHCQVKTDLPTRCAAGNDHWSPEELRAAIPEFAKVHASRPILKNKGGGGINHAFALWFTIKKLQPKYIIESGVWHGESTWLMRTAAGNDTKIFSIDPVGMDWLKWQDENPNTQYFMGEKFVDFNEIKWDEHIPEEDRANTLVMLDDHMSSIRRVKEMLSHKFVHLWYDDNYKYAPTWMGLTYSFNEMCSKVVKNVNGRVPYHDLFGTDSKGLTEEKHEEYVKFLQDHLDVYFEFPAVWDRCASEGRTSLLTIGEGSAQDERGTYVMIQKDGPLSKDLALHGLPAVRADPYTYASHFPPYVKLKL